jgi:hypothetical protein
MVTARSERPRFFDGQYIGAADLAATVDYARELAREGVLAGQSWGICIGLDLVEVAKTGGGFDYFVLPGLAFDGYGRPIVVLAPAPVPASLFADLATGNQAVWVRYDERQNQGLRPGWQTCVTADSYARVRESYAIEAGPKLLSERQSGVDVAGDIVPDARLALNAISPEQPLICDASIPHQTYPADTARWLVPLGAASWVSGVPGAFAERSAEGKKTSRVARRYVGQIAESLFAADGVLRLRDRKTDLNDTKTIDEQCTAIIAEDMVAAPDPKDATKTVDRLVGKELVWVEGNMRVTGDARLWGTKLEFRTAKGEDGGAPLLFNRSPTANINGGYDLELTIGAAADGKSRFVAGARPAGQPLDARFQFKNDGRIAVGNAIAADFKGHTIIAHTTDNTSVAIAAASNKLAKVQFAISPALNEMAAVGWDDAIKVMKFGVGPDATDNIFISAQGKVGIHTETPEKQDTDANDLVVYSAANVGMTLQCDENFNGRINFSDGVDLPDDRHAGSILYRHQQSRMEFWTAGTMQATITAAGNLGIGTSAPDDRIDIQSTVNSRHLTLGAEHIQAKNGGGAAQLELQHGGGSLLVNGGLPAAQQVFIGSDGRIGLGITAPSGTLHLRHSGSHINVESTSNAPPKISFASGGLERSSIEMDPAVLHTRLIHSNIITLSAIGGRVGINTGTAAPIANLHVKGSVAGSASDIANHVAVVENTSGADADVLALKVGGAANGNNNFITFFDNSGPIGRIERSTLGDLGGSTNTNQESPGNFLRLVSGAADFAECLERSSPAHIGPGRIVGVRAGRVSLDTGGADALLVTTDRAIVLGNAPDDRSDVEMVTMIGQVPVFVRGPVTAGDFIIPSGQNDGSGVAVSPEFIDNVQAGAVVGKAWASCPRSDLRRVLAAIGVSGATTASANAMVVARQSQTIAALEARLDALVARLDS